eukprot:CAMPEP_0179177728 /NCGR_PEP_ID=MMETSP0796-20121207/87898_1 /TAXON_ID=73915 /ORGANISM="Pyrodinium bahamense, Strain pbaha01" /LENGTH=63 /DNA_ID=CAMNT_0020881285 /DNA_START=1 /DNA_END=189 /DNA_ORIENTATION=+
MFLPNPFIYCHMHSFRDFQENFWPIFMRAERLECQQQESKDTDIEWWQFWKPLCDSNEWEPYW